MVELFALAVSLYSAGILFSSGVALLAFASLPIWKPQCLPLDGLEEALAALEDEEEENPITGLRITLPRQLPQLAAVPVSFSGDLTHATDELESQVSPGGTHRLYSDSVNTLELAKALGFDSILTAYPDVALMASDTTATAVMVSEGRLVGWRKRELPKGEACLQAVGNFLEGF